MDQQTGQTNERILDALNEMLFHDASRHLYHDERQLRVEGLLTLKRLRNECSKRFLDRVDRVTSRGLDLFGVNLSGADLSEMRLTNIIFQEAKLLGLDLDVEGANPKVTNLSSANLENANLKGANLTGADLIKANLTGADLTGATFENANLKGATLTEATLTDADLTGAGLNKANFKGAVVSRAKLPFDSREEALKVLRNFDSGVGNPDYVDSPDQFRPPTPSMPTR